MTDGTVEAIYIAPAQGADTVYKETIHAVPGLGIEGDRYFNHSGTLGVHEQPDRELTLIEIETIEAISSQEGIPITPDKTRRNIVTRGISLNDLVDQDFTVGNVCLHGIRLCEPCDYLAGRTDKRILTAMAHRGGLRASILTEGYIHTQDVITYP